MRSHKWFPSNSKSSIGQGHLLYHNQDQYHLPYHDPDLSLFQDPNQDQDLGRYPGQNQDQDQIRPDLL